MWLLDNLHGVELSPTGFAASFCCTGTFTSQLLIMLGTQQKGQTVRLWPKIGVTKRLKAWFAANHASEAENARTNEEQAAGLRSCGAGRIEFKIVDEHIVRAGAGQRHPRDTGI